MRNRRPRLHVATAAFIAGFAFGPAIPPAEAATNAAPVHFLLNDRLGKATRVPTNEVHSWLHPRARTGLGQEIPATSRGLAWQQSLSDGKVVVLAGLVNPSNCLDTNTCANSSQGRVTTMSHLPVVARH